MSESQNKLIVIGFVTIFFLGRLTASEIVRTEVKTIKVTDTEAVERARLEERKKIQSQFKQKKVRDTTKLPDGTIKTHEEIANERISEETAEISKKYDLDVMTHETEKTTVKSLQNNFAAELLIGKEKFNFFNTLPQDSLIFGANLSYRVFGSTWIGVWGLWSEKQIYGVSVRQEF
jgi:hypothetical protein